MSRAVRVDVVANIVVERESARQCMSLKSHRVSAIVDATRKPFHRENEDDDMKRGHRRYHRAVKKPWRGCVPRIKN